MSGVCRGGSVESIPHTPDAAPSCRLACLTLDASETNYQLAVPMWSPGRGLLHGKDVGGLIMQFSSNVHLPITPVGSRRATACMPQVSIHIVCTFSFVHA